MGADRWWSGRRISGWLAAPGVIKSNLGVMCVCVCGGIEEEFTANVTWMCRRICYTQFDRVMTDKIGSPSEDHQTATMWNSKHQYTEHVSSHLPSFRRVAAVDGRFLSDIRKWLQDRRVICCVCKSSRLI